MNEAESWMNVPPTGISRGGQGATTGSARLDESEYPSGVAPVPFSTDDVHRAAQATTDDFDMAVVDARPELPGSPFLPSQL